MSTKSTIILTNENEHIYHEGVDNTIVLEFSKKNIGILINDDEDLVIEIKNNESELSEYFHKLYPNNFK